MSRDDFLRLDESTGFVNNARESNAAVAVAVADCGVDVDVDVDVDVIMDGRVVKVKLQASKRKRWVSKRSRIIHAVHPSPEISEFRTHPWQSLMKPL
jgi:hypothetical protein